MVAIRDQQSVLSIRARVDASDVPSFIREALDEVRVDIERLHLEVQGPPFCIRHPSRKHEVDVEVGWPVDRASTIGRASVCAIPHGLARRGSRYNDACSKRGGLRNAG